MAKEPVTEEKTRERELLRTLLDETPPFDTYGLLEKLFGKFKNLHELPVRAERLSQFPISFLVHAISPDRLIRCQKAISYLYPMTDEILSDLRRSSHFKYPLSFAQIAALFRFWAVLSSDRLKKVIYALAKLDLSELPLKQRNGNAVVQNANIQAILEIYSSLCILNASKDDAMRLFDREIVSIPSSDELELIAKTRKPLFRSITDFYDEIRNPTMDNEYDHHLILCIDPYNEIDDIMAKVRGIIELHHETLKEKFCQEKEVPRGIGYFSPLRHPLKVFQEMDIFLPYRDKKLFNEIDPLQYFQLKEKGDKGRDTQTITDDNFHALITYDLRKRDMRPVDIERRFFGLTAAPKTNAYKAQTKAHNDHYKRAERLISRALACAPIQL